jgi:hypothetical protein
VSARVARRLRIGLAGLLAVATLLPSAGATAGAEPVMSRPTATATFLRDIAFVGSATLSGGIRRIEIVIDVEGGSRSLVADIPLSRDSGTVALEYVMDTPGGALLPGTDVAARFRATLEDGSLVDGPSVSVRYEDTRLDWRTLRGELVTVHWTEGGADFGRRALAIGEAAVRDVGDLLGVTESEAIDFYVYADRDFFYDVIGAGARENVGGQAHPDIRTLFANISPGAIDDPWVGVVIPHELTHLVFDTAVANPYHYPPRWLNEGLAVYLAEGFSDAHRRDLDAAARAGTVMPLQALAAQFPTTADQFFLAYAESVAAVDYLVREHGQPALVSLVRSYAAGVTDDEAFRAAIGVDVAGFERDWLASIGAPAPRPFGPVDAPAGPVPSDWLGAGPVPGEIPGASASPEPAPSPGSPVGPGDDAVDGGGLLAALVALGLAVAGIGGVAFRRQRARVPLPAPVDAAAAEDPDG